jgi:glutamate-1-semialdehyde 2,1-aminomutase
MNNWHIYAGGKQMNEPVISKELFTRAQNLMPGGVNSPVRAFKAVGLAPLFIDRANGSRIYDVDGNEYIDYVCSWGPLILGHAHPQIIEAISVAASKGTSYGAPCEKEIKLAELICEAIPSIEKVRMVNSGTEATMSAIRLARAYTGRDKIVKFEGCYHGHADSFLIKAGSGLLTSGVASSPGIPKEVVVNTMVSPYNDAEALDKLFLQWGNEIAAVIVEPVAGNMGLILPDKEFLLKARQLTEHYGSLLIFDEVITGFRTCYGAYQNIVDIKADITTLGKIIGGGLPVGAYGGREDIMSRVAPEGDVYQAGTLSGNPLAMAAGAKTLEILKKSDIYQYIADLGDTLVEGIKKMLGTYGRGLQINRLGSMFSLFFCDHEVKDFASVMKCRTDNYAAFYRLMLQQGIYFPPSQFEVCFISAAHTKKDIELTLAAIEKSLINIPN